MGRSILCEAYLGEELEKLPAGNSYIPGLILGQYGGSKDYVISLPRSRLFGPEAGGDAEVSQIVASSISDIEESSLVQHSRTVTRMLGGGLWVLGLYIVSPSDIFADKNAVLKLKRLAQAVYNSTRDNSYLFGQNPTNALLLFHFSSLTKKFTCKSMDMTPNSTLTPAEWKFKSGITSWLQVDTRFSLSRLPPVRITHPKCTTKNKMLEVLKRFQEQLDRLVPSINGEFSLSDRTLASIGSPLAEGTNKSRRSIGGEGKETQRYELMFYEFELPSYLEGGPDKGSRGMVLREKELLLLNGTLASQVYLHEKCSAEEATRRVKEDLLRSLGARLEMHWQTFEEPDKQPSRFLIRRPPRRVLFRPENSKIGFSEYLFEGESESDALATLTENLTCSDVGELTHLELPWDTSAYLEETETGGLQGGTDKRSSGSASVVSPLLLYGIIGAFLCLFLSITAHFILAK